MKIYVNKDGYKIKATKKAFKMFYEKQGFQEEKSSNAGQVLENATSETVMDDTEDNASDEVSETSGEKDIEDLSVAELKEALTKAGISFSSKASKKELQELLLMKQEA